MTAGLSNADREALVAVFEERRRGIRTDDNNILVTVAALIASARGQALDDAAKALLLMAAERMDEHGPHDARGAAIWDCGVFLREQFDQTT